MQGGGGSRKSPNRNSIGNPGNLNFDLLAWSALEKQEHENTSFQHPLQKHEGGREAQEEEKDGGRTKNQAGAQTHESKARVRQTMTHVQAMLWQAML